MKRLSEIFTNGQPTGTFNYSNGMIGTRDLPAFVAETAYFRKHTGVKQQFMLDSISGVVPVRESWREQLAKVAKQIKL